MITTGEEGPHDKVKVSAAAVQVYVGVFAETCLAGGTVDYVVIKRHCHLGAAVM